MLFCIQCPEGGEFNELCGAFNGLNAAFIGVFVRVLLHAEFPQGKQPREGYLLKRSTQG